MLAEAARHHCARGWWVEDNGATCVGVEHVHLLKRYAMLFCLWTFSVAQHTWRFIAFVAKIEADRVVAERVRSGTRVTSFSP